MFEEDTTCAVGGVDHRKVAEVTRHMLGLQTYQALAQVFRALGDETRVQVLDALSRQELCVCDLSAVLGMNASAISHHLRTLRNLQLVRHRRAGKKVYYALSDQHVTILLAQALDHVQHNR